MTYEEAKLERDYLESEMAAAEAVLKTFPREGLMNLPTEEVRLSGPYRAAKATSNEAFARLRNFNDIFVKRFAKELRAERRNRYK